MLRNLVYLSTAFLMLSMFYFDYSCAKVDRELARNAALTAELSATLNRIK